MSSKYVSLHTHTTYSLLDGISRREDIISKAKSIGMPAIGLTEHGNLCNAISFYKNCKDAGIVPIIGFEAYVAPDSRKNRDYKADSAVVEELGDVAKYAHHLTLLAKNRVGYNNIKKLSTIGWREGFYRKPRIDLEALSAHKEGVICLSGCLASLTAKYILADQKDKALDYINILRGLFGTNFYLELMAHQNIEDAKVNEALLYFSKTQGIGAIITNDSHYTNESDAYAHEVALAIGTGKTITDPSRFQFRGSGYWFKSHDEISATAKAASIPQEAVDLTGRIASEIEDYGFKIGKSIIPLFRDTAGEPYSNESCDQMLEMSAWTGLSERGLISNPTYTDRLTHELQTIKEKKFSSYFLIIADIINFMRASNILPPIGRGSSVGSLVCYCLYITGLDPVKLEIPFSRFINAGRKDLPDIDTDISKERRSDVINYIINKYGHNRVSQIVTFMTMGPKAVVDNVGRALGVPSQVRREIGILIGETGPDDTLQDILDSNKKVLERISAVPDWATISLALEGNHKSLSEHAAGVVIANEDIQEYTPLLKDSKAGHVVTQFDMRDLGALGMLKLDMLGLNTMDLIQHSIELIKQRHGVVIDFTKMPMEDKETYELVASGRYVSVFQYDSTGMRSTAKQLKPDKFDHLIALNALYRPGPMKNETMPDGTKGKSILDHYMERRHGRELAEVWHPVLEPVFRATYGMPIFQESVMNMTKAIANFNDTEADEYRAAIGKKCLTLDSQILSCDSDRFSIRELRDNPHLLSKLDFWIHDGSILSVNGPTRGKFTSLRSNGVQQIYKIRTSTGRVLRLSSEHRVATFEGDKRVSDLNVDDCLLRQDIDRNSLLDSHIDSVLSDRAILLGLLTGDGKCSTVTPGFVQHDGPIADLFVDLINKLEFITYVKDTTSNPSGVPIYRIINHHPSDFNLVKDMLTFDGINTTAEHKRIPSSIRASKYQHEVSAFMAGHFMSDGYAVSSAPETAGGVHYFGFATHSFLLAQDIQIALNKLNIESTIRHKQYITHINNKEYKGTTYECAIRSSDSIVRFNETIGLYLVGDKKNKVYDIANENAKKLQHTRTAWPNSILSLIAKQPNFTSISATGLRNSGKRVQITNLVKLSHLGDDIKNINNSKLLPEYVKSIELDGVEETFDISTNSNTLEHFFCNDILIHNSKEKFDLANEKLVRGGVASGHSETFMLSIVDKLMGFARYGWNIGHAASYSYIAYVTAYLEAHYPLEYYTTLLNVSLDDNDKLKAHLSAILQHGVQILPPHINNSSDKFEADDKSIYMGLYSIRQIGDKSTIAIIKDRAENGKYKDFIDFCVRMSPYSKDVTKTVKANLIKSGAFKWDTSTTNKDRIANLELIQSIVTKAKKKNKTPDETRKDIEKLFVRTNDEYQEHEMLDLEQSVLNFYISSHPVTRFQPLLTLFDLKPYNLITPCQLMARELDEMVLMLCMVESKELKMTKNNKPYLAMKVCDHSDTVHVMVWSPLALRVNDVVATNSLVLIAGNIKADNFRAGDNQINVTSVVPIINDGLPLKEFFADNPMKMAAIVDVLGAKVGRVADIPGFGLAVELSEPVYMKPQHFIRLSGMYGVEFKLLSGR